MFIDKQTCLHDIEHWIICPRTTSITDDEEGYLSTYKFLKLSMKYKLRPNLL